jgi:hypothetical protein
LSLQLQWKSLKLYIWLFYVLPLNEMSYFLSELFLIKKFATESLTWCCADKYSRKGTYEKCVTVPLHITLYAGFGRTVNSFSDSYYADNWDNGNCTLEASPLLHINNTTSTVHKLFIHLEVNCYKFLRK